MTSLIAPNFSGSYPGAGERIGPAWQIAWDKLVDGEWATSDELASAMCGGSDIKWKTAKCLLAEARASGVITVRYRRINKCRRALYRINPPELSNCATGGSE